MIMYKIFAPNEIPYPLYRIQSHSNIKNLIGCQNTDEGYRGINDNSVHPIIKDLIARMLDPDDEKRISALEAFEILDEHIKTVYPEVNQAIDDKLLKKNV